MDTKNLSLTETPIEITDRNTAAMVTVVNRSAKAVVYLSFGATAPSEDNKWKVGLPLEVGDVHTHNDGRKIWAWANGDANVTLY